MANVSNKRWQILAGWKAVADPSQGVLLDSSAIIAHFRGSVDVFQLIESEAALFMPLVVFGELWKGALKSAAPRKHQAKIYDLMKVVGLILPDSATAKHYARISVALEERGRPIPENDLWIAAVALELEMPLVTRDAHFDRIKGLAVIHC